MRSDGAPRNFAGLRVTVMGLGRFGGGIGAIRFLAARGARITVTDSKPESALSESLAELQGICLEAAHLGGHRSEDFTAADLIVASPAVARDNAFLQQAFAAGVPVTSEMNLFWQHNRAPVVAVTGSNGKSTTTALTYNILTATGRTCHLGGNIGHSLLPVVDDIRPNDLVVLELSSFQLEDLDRLQVSPHVAVVTNFAPNHLDWHGTVESYRRAKQTIVRWQSTADFAVLNAEDSDVAAWETRGNVFRFGLCDSGREGAYHATNRALLRFSGMETDIPLRDWFALPGRHNVQNALAAICAATACGAGLTAIEQGLRTYQPLPHRLQLVAECGGRRFYNDSLATTPESAIVALESFDEPIVLLAGGYDKKVDLGPMAESIAARVKGVALMGQTGPRLGAQIREHALRRADRIPALHVALDFADAFAWATTQSAPGDVVLLSPGCASYDWFRNFSDRGRQFEALAKAWSPEGRPS